MTDYDALVNELRECRNKAVYSPYWWEITTRAADAIEQMAAENKEIVFRANQLEAINDALYGETGNCDAIIAAREANRWIPVTERLPSEYARYLTVLIEPWLGTTVVDIMRWSGIWLYDGRQMEAKVTHWMPIPTPPEEET